ncbi:hypothetical protein ABIE44_000017 [Marmoricola sp. OAE513]|uniref:HNH endonuclease signature motif containing protein n=1 Tax=Marmoricola sp. OAE513 TaxID=2817894 RepID=UPI001AE7246D
MTLHDLVRSGVDELIAENRSAARRSHLLLQIYLEFRRRCPGKDDPHALSARQQAVVEVSEAWAVPASWVRSELNNAIWIVDHFAHLGELARAGALDPYRVRLIADAARHGLETTEEYAAFADKMTPFLSRHLREDGLVTCTHKQLRNRVSYLIKKIRSADAEAQFRNAHQHRDVVVDDGEHGISWLTIAGTTDQIAVALRRLTLEARALRAAGDRRTVEQIKADLAVDLLTGAATHAPPAYARPVINLTVPIQTVMGLSGGQVIPAGLARVIAQRPGATWHRMLTDPAGQAVELSTENYRPTRAIWEQVVGTQTTCFRPGCDHASTECDLDHRTAWPRGATTAKNLNPACRTDHRAKQTPGFAVRQTDNGSFVLDTPGGFSHHLRATSHPVSSEWVPLGGIQFSATELGLALDHLAARAGSQDLAGRGSRPDLSWEHDPRWWLAA